MGKLLMNMQEQAVLWLFLLAAFLLAVIFLNLYLGEKKKRIRAEQRIKGKEKFDRAFALNSREIYLYVQKKDLKVLYFTPNFKEITGLEPEMLERNVGILKKLVDNRSARKIKKRIEEWNQAEELDFEINYQTSLKKEKKRARVMIMFQPKEEGYLVLLQDITREYKTRQKMKGELKAARRESQSKTDFLSKMSHEIRTPMNGILGMLNLIQVHLAQPEMARKYLDKTEELSKFLIGLINDILDMSRIESGKMQLDQSVFDLNAMADKLDAMFRNTAEAKGIHWSVEMKDFDTHYVIGDEMRLSQVIINFISNANKFTPAGGKVCVTFRQMDKIEDKLHLMIRVSDTGRGMEEGFLSKIFRPFEQEDASTAQNYGGSGLGMAIADNLVKLMDGQILVESERGKGTEFTVYISLPIAEEAEREEAKELMETKVEQERQKEIESFSLEGIRILLAEDNAINAEIAMELLDMQGAVVTRAENGQEAVRIFEQSVPGSFDVILMDIQMPVMDGWEATKVIRKMPRMDAELPIFAMSANAFLEDQRRSLEVGMNGHINKPVDYDEVRRLIGEQMYLRK